jgi:hypothetical protein
MAGAKCQIVIWTVNAQKLWYSLSRADRILPIPHIGYRQKGSACSSPALRSSLPNQASRLSVALGYSLQLVLLLDGVRVGRTLSGVGKLIGQTLGDRLDVVESGFTGLKEKRKNRSNLSGGHSQVTTYTNGQQGDGLVNPPQGRDIDGLTPDGSLGSDTGGVFTGTSVDNGVDENLDRVLVGQEVDDLESVSNDSDSQKLLSVVPSVHHQTVEKSIVSVQVTTGLIGTSI